MREMAKWNVLSDQENGVIPNGVLVGDKVLVAGPAHFGTEIIGDVRFNGQLSVVTPYDACSAITNGDIVKGSFGIAQRGQCTFAEKVRNMQTAGVELAIILDNIEDSSSENTATFAMSGDGKDDITIPAVFLFSKESLYLFGKWKTDDKLTVTVGELKSMKREFENDCDGTKCDAVEQTTTESSADTESFVHLKKVLNQLVAQFELGDNNQIQEIDSTCEETAPDAFLSHSKIINENGEEDPIQHSKVCAIKSAPISTLLEKDSATMETETKFDEA